MGFTEIRCVRTYRRNGGIDFASHRNDPVPSGCTIDEAELNGLFFNLIDNGYSGLAFIQGGTFIGIEWKDLMLPPAE